MHAQQPQDGLSDQELVLKAFIDQQYYGEIIERYQQPLLRFIKRISSFNDAEAEEILQETFLQAWVKLHSYDDSLSFSSWMYRIARNKTISEFRKHQSRGLDKQDELDNALYDITGSDESIMDDTNAVIDGEHVREVLSALSQEHREVLVLRFLEQYSYEEISDIIRKPGGTVATLLSRAKKAFAQTWNRLYPHPS
jgi:RNA polymerase sigma-70 factor (ECF subfamily)